MSSVGNPFLPINITIPGNLLITAITQTNPMVVTFINSVVNTYVLKQCVVLTVPYTYGMFQANGLTGVIIAINSNNFTLSIDALNFDQFVVPSGAIEQPASMSPGGSRNLQYNNFTNLVAFQPLNNIGN